ncbi:hypothetical protein FRC19_002411 [Serendipita sp. 401]|nr:hypothetical protein FRC19_002411 [Serendipita sp. 401]
MIHPLSYESAVTLISLSIGLAILFKLGSRGKSKPKRRKDHGFIKLSAGQDPTIDIIAIHGLDGHREQSWTAENEKLWLKDFLPNDLPNARILSYGYDADTRSFIQTSSKTISHHAEDFVERLSQLRRMHPRRPIIFLAHSLGGIILKRALVLCHSDNFETDRKLRDISTSTLAVLFFGTPHSGANGIQLAEWMGRLFSMYMYTNTRILSDLNRDSPKLEDIQRHYQSVTMQLSTIFFYEEYETPILGGRTKLIVPRHLAVIPGDNKARVASMHADHCEMVKYTSADDENYCKVVDYLVELSERAKAKVDEN